MTYWGWVSAFALGWMIAAALFTGGFVLLSHIGRRRRMPRVFAGKRRGKRKIRLFQVVAPQHNACPVMAVFNNRWPADLRWDR